MNAKKSKIIFQTAIACVCIVILIAISIGVFSAFNAGDYIQPTALIFTLAMFIISLRHKGRHKRWFKSRVKTLQTVCSRPSDEYQFQGDPLFCSFNEENFFIQLNLEENEFRLCSYTYVVFPSQTEIWDKAVGNLKSRLDREVPNVKLQTRTEGQLGRSFSLTMTQEDAKKKLLLFLAHLLVGLKGQLATIFVSEIYFKTRIFDVVCYGECSIGSIARAVSIHPDGSRSIVDATECNPEDFVKSDPPMSVMLQYTLSDIEADMLVGKDEFEAQWDIDKAAE